MSGVVIVALPIGDKKVTYADGDTTPVHQTLVYLGDSENVTPHEAARVMVEVETIADFNQPAIIKVSGKGTLGPEQERVIFTESLEINAIREQLLDNPIIQEVMMKAEQHPNWIPHITGMQNLTYGDHIIVNRLAVWYGDDRREYPLGKPGVILED